MNEDNGEGLRALFYGLCTLHNIEVVDMQGSDAMPSDFCVTDHKFPCHVVIVAEPDGRQDDIAALRRRGVPLIILNKQDLTDLGRCPDAGLADAVVDIWLRNDTRAAAVRRQIGLD
jgi:hypothetical protein